MGDICLKTGRNKMLFFLYHDVIFDNSTSGFQANSASKYKIPEQTFKEHLEAISESNYSFWEGNSNQEGNSICLTFDDGGISNLKTASLLEKYHARGIFFIVTDLINKDGFLSSEQILNLHKRGHWIGSHSQSHPDRMAFVSESKLFLEWNNSKKDLENIIKSPIKICSVPGGSISKNVINEADKAGYSLLFNSMPSKESQTTLIENKNGIKSIGRISITSSWSGKKLKDFLKNTYIQIQIMKFIYFLKQKLVHQNRFFSWLYNYIRRFKKDLY